MNKSTSSYSVAKSDSNGYLTTSEISRLSKYFKQGSDRLRLVNKLQEIQDEFSRDVVDFIFNIESIDFDIDKEVLLKHIDFIFRLIGYCLLNGTTDPIDDYLEEVIDYKSKKFNPEIYIKSLNYIKKNHGFSDEQAVYFNENIDYLINLFS